ncbi:MAG: ribose 5-phosphate isomerase B [Limnochordaceae bacterium]|nr:ribose 5-phosphate isomerase B [Limnochordaceae bacterium]
MAQVLFVCSGNTCRSPLAAALFQRALVRRNLAAEVGSAGVSASDGEAASGPAQEVAREWGFDLSRHRSRRAAADLVRSAELVLAMTEAHKRQLLQMAPEAAGRVFTLAEYAGTEGDVDDPFGQDLDRYRATMRQIETLTERAADRWERSHGHARDRVMVGWDHAGRVLREPVVEVLRQAGLQVEETGPEEGQPADYPDVARQVAEAVASGKAAFGVLLCGTGIGMSIAANKVRGVRAALCHDPFSARMARAHNDANVLAMGGRVIGPGPAGEVVRAFLEGKFEGGRHGRRVEKIAGLEHPSC